MPPDTRTAFSSLSARGSHLAATPARADFDLFMQAAQDPYHPDTNPEGKMPLNVAENSPMIAWVQERTQAILRAGPLPEWIFKYTQPVGHPDVRASVAQFMSQYLCQCPVSPDHIAFGAGAAAIIEVSSFVLADPGDVVVIPAPAYPMYTHDLGAKSGMERYDLQTHYHLSEHGEQGPVTPDRLDQAWADLQAQGKRFRLLLLTSPDNPTGCMYEEAQLRELADWCIRHEVHLVVSEIYGLSLIDPAPQAQDHAAPAFDKPASFAQVMAERRSDYLHLWYALSKDFAMSGLRFGLLHSLNEGLLQGFANANIPHMVSNLTQWVVGQMFRQTDFIEAYLQENRRRLTESYRVVTDALDHWAVPYLPIRGSLFVWADLSRFLTEDSAAGEDQLWHDIFQHTGVLLTPGRGFGHQKRGLFRLVYTAVPTSHLRVAMERLGAYFSAR